MTQLKPLNNYLLVQQEKEQEKTKGGLYMPQVTNTAADLLRKGTVLAVSEDIENKSVKEGMKVYYNKLAITNIPDEEDTILVRVEDVYAFES